MPALDQRPTVFLDFDGTISSADVVDAVLERFAGRGWLRFEEEWRAGRMGSRECLGAQMALVRASRDELDALVGAMEIDAGFAPLLETCSSTAVSVHIVSDGFDYCIERVFERLPSRVRRRLTAAPVHASHLEPAGKGRWRPSFPFYREECGHGCATCKPAVMLATNPSGAPTVFVGDGLSDRYAAAAADVVFAKDALAAYCSEQGLAHIRFDHLGEVASCLEDGIRRGRSWRRSATARARA